MVVSTYEHTTCIYITQTFRSHIWTYFTTRILSGWIFSTKAKFLIRSPILKKSSILTAKDSETCMTGGVLISTGSLPLMTWVCNRKMWLWLIFNESWNLQCAWLEILFQNSWPHLSMSFLVCDLHQVVPPLLHPDTSHLLAQWKFHSGGIRITLRECS